HVERTAGNVEALELADQRREAARQRHPACRDAEQYDPVTAVRPFQDLVSDPGQRPPDLLGIEHREAITPRDRIAGRAHRRDLLPRLTGRSLKDVYVGDHTGSYHRPRQLCAQPTTCDLRHMGRSPTEHDERWLYGRNMPAATGNLISAGFLAAGGGYIVIRGS